jgi:hypothetical protein
MSAAKLLLALVVALALGAAPASAAVGLPASIPPVSGNPADRLASLPIEDFRYDPATKCSPKPRRGMALFTSWLQRNAGGVSWGTYRCEKWGKRSASLHAEGRALDWHLDATRRADRAEAKRLVLLLLAPDARGNTQALARRMGVEEIIWDCGYWAMGMTQFSDYRVCFDRKGKPLERVDPTQAHRDHIHFGLTKAGAAARTSFWSNR